MKDWQGIPEITGCNAMLRMAVLQAFDAVEQRRNLLVEGESGTGRRLLVRAAWSRRSPGTSSLFTVDCRIFTAESIEEILFGREGMDGAKEARRLRLAPGCGLLLLHVEELPHKLQLRLITLLRPRAGQSRRDSMQIMMTCAPRPDATLPLHRELAALLIRVRVPALRERVEDIRALSETFLRAASPFDPVRCSQALIDRFCSYDWPGNVSELRAVLRRLIVQPHHGMLDVRHLAELAARDELALPILAWPAPHSITGLSEGGSLQ